MPKASAASDALAQLCLDLRVLREQAGGPSVRALGERVGLGKSQIDAILNGRIRRPPEWHVVSGLVEAFYKYAHDSGHESRLSIHAGLREYWRPRYAMVEHAFSQSPDRGEERGRADSLDVVEQQAHAVAPRQLPPIAPHFAGRQAELAQLTSVTSRASGCGPLLISGMAGVGKTTLAVAWAHQEAHRFPDGQLYIDLRGFDPSGRTVPAAQAVRALLEALAVAPRAIPQDLEAQIGLYRSILARRNMLVLLDNARDTEQVRALLPGAATCQTVITSRMELTGLVVADGAYPMRLEVLPQTDARQMLDHRVGRDRASAEPESVDALIEMCGRLPIALAIVGARAATRPSFRLSAIVEEMRRALRGLDAFQIGNNDVDLRALFSWSYAALSAPAARLFRLLSLHIGGHVGEHAAASMLGAPAPQVSSLLTELVRAHLLAEVGPGLYGSHDLLRTYALEEVGSVETDAERDAARRRMFDHYVHTACAAAMLMSPQRAPITAGALEPGVSLRPLHDREEAMGWFTAERAVLLGAAEQAVSGGYDGQAWRLGWAMADFLELRGHFHDWLGVQQHAVTAARRLEDPQTLARNLMILGNASVFAGHYEQASVAIEEAIEIHRSLGDVAGQARCVHILGGQMERQGRHTEALECSRRALALYQSAGDREGQARSHNAIGWCLSLLGQHEEAIAHCQRALQGYQELGETNGQAATWDSLGAANHALGRFDRALHCFGQALALLRDNGDRFNEAGVLTHIGDVYDASGDAAVALRQWEQALAILDDLDHPGAEELRARLAAR